MTRQQSLSLLILGASFAISACSSPAGDVTAPVAPDGSAAFEWFEYAGQDSVFANDISDEEYRNPIISGFYPDPSIVRAGDDYYLVNSTFSYFPGIPIFHSRDLVNWTRIGNLIDRPDMLSFDGLHLGQQGLYAPTIEYHDGLFLSPNTCVGCGGNFVITATDPAGPWSDPIWIEGVGGIDPSLYFEDGRAWMLNHNDPAGPKLYDGHKAIWIREVDPQTYQPIGERTMLIDGGVNIEEEPGYVEGAHIYKVGEYYYLWAAEGGTELNHRQAVWRSKNVDGPYETYAGNPVLTQRHLPFDRKDPITATGHSDLVQTQNGDWWAVFLATRPYDGAHFVTGRETFLLPVTWRDGWPTVLVGDELVPYTTKKPDLPAGKASPKPVTGNFTTRHEFDAENLANDWLFVRVPREKWWDIDGGALKIKPRADRIGDVGQPSLIARRVQHTNMTATTAVSLSPSAAPQEAGLITLQNDGYFYAFGLTVGGDEPPVLTVRKRAGDDQPARGIEIARVPAPMNSSEPIKLRVTITGKDVGFSYSTDDEPFTSVLAGAESEILSSYRSGGFTGATIGMYAEKK